MSIKQFNRQVVVCITTLCLLLVACQPGTAERPSPNPGPDTDGDWVSDADEEKYGTNSTTWDTDDDGSTDFQEIFIVGSNPTVAEGNTDGDCCRDITEEKLYDTDPSIADEDEDGDGIPDSIELTKGSHPGKADTDGDLLSDYIEIYLTETDPAVADVIADSGVPQPLIAWMPDDMVGIPCQFQIGATIDQLTIIDPEEADGDNIVGGDEAYLNYGLWVDVPDPDDVLLYIWQENPTHSWGWQGDVYQDDSFSKFNAVQPIIAGCGQTVTFAIQAWESDAPWGSGRDFGVWLEHIPLLIDSIPPIWNYSYSNSMYFEGTGGDSDYYRYSIDYSITAEPIN